MTSTEASFPEETKPGHDLIFDLPKSEWRSWDALHKWGEAAGLSKRITFHVARHTFATMILEATGNIYLVSKLLGHSSIQHTVIYAKIIDDSKRAAMMSLPEIDL